MGKQNQGVRLMLHKIINSLLHCTFVENYKIAEYFNEDTIQFIKIIATLKNNNTLYIREFLSIDERKYSYHWQDSNNRLILRWSNIPNNPLITTSPGYLARRNRISSFNKIFINEILTEIGRYLK